MIYSDNSMRNDIEQYFVSQGAKNHVAKCLAEFFSICIQDDVYRNLISFLTKHLENGVHVSVRSSLEHKKDKFELKMQNLRRLTIDQIKSLHRFADYLSQSIELPFDVENYNVKKNVQRRLVHFLFGEPKQVNTIYAVKQLAKKLWDDYFPEIAKIKTKFLTLQRKPLLELLQTKQPTELKSTNMIKPRSRAITGKIGVFIDD